jgi:uncharacterized cupredoxin-like copper-binding protein
MLLNLSRRPSVSLLTALSCLTLSLTALNVHAHGCQGMAKDKPSPSDQKEHSQHGQHGQHGRHGQHMHDQQQGHSPHAHNQATKKSQAETTRPSKPSTQAFPWGQAAEASAVTRTIRIRMSDAMRFSPEQLSVKQGETIRFVVENGGKMLHEMVIGTREELAKHAELMRKHPQMEHDEPYMAHVSAGQTGTMIWRFTNAGTFEFACLIPGHFEAGMRGTIVVQATTPAADAKKA